MRSLGGQLPFATDEQTEIGSHKRPFCVFVRASERACVRACAGPIGRVNEAPSAGDMLLEPIQTIAIESDSLVARARHKTLAKYVVAISSSNLQFQAETLCKRKLVFRPAQRNCIAS